MSHKVELYVYDISNGMASSLSPLLLNIHIEAIYHTSIVIFNKEIFFGGDGITNCRPGTTYFGRPNEIIQLGETAVSETMLFEYLFEARQRFTPAAYNILRNNCNHFTDDVAFFLTGRHIPSKIINLPDEIMATPFGQAILPMLEGANVNLGGSSLEDWKSEREERRETEKGVARGAKKKETRTRVCDEEEYMWTKGRDENIKAYVGLLLESKKCNFSETALSFLNRFAESYSQSAAPIDASILSQIETTIRTTLFRKPGCDYVLNFENLSNSDLVSLFALLRVIVQENPKAAKTFAAKDLIRPCLSLWHGEKLTKSSNALKIAVLSYFCALFGVLGLDRAKNAGQLSEFAGDSDLLDAMAESWEENEYVRITKSAVLFNCAISGVDHDSAVQLVCILVERAQNEKSAKLATRLLRAIEKVIDGNEGVMETIAILRMELGDCAFGDKDTCEKWKTVEKKLSDGWKGPCGRD